MERPRVRPFCLVHSGPSGFRLSIATCFDRRSPYKISATRECPDIARFRKLLEVLRRLTLSFPKPWPLPLRTYRVRGPRCTRCHHHRYHLSGVGSSFVAALLAGFLCDEIPNRHRHHRHPHPPGFLLPLLSFSVVAVYSLHQPLLLLTEWCPVHVPFLLPVLLRSEPRLLIPSSHCHGRPGLLTGLPTLPLAG